MARRVRQTRQRQRQARLRLANITVLRGFVSRRSWIQDVNRTFDRLYRQDCRATFADALRTYADELEGITDDAYDVPPSNASSSSHPSAYDELQREA